MLADSLSLDPLRDWWPRYLFHTTELRNAIAILDSGQLLSREDAGDEMAWDNANPKIIGHTPDAVKQMARFYFRPRTPTTYNIEGFRTQPNRYLQAYCPLPVMLVLPALPILTETGTRFSNGNCSSRDTRIGEDAAFFLSLPFGDIYHDAPWQSEDADRIRHHRQAEVLVPSPFNIRSHRLQIRVRSIAERETLLSLLRPTTAKRYRDDIQVSSKAPLFHKLWSYIESVSAFDSELTIRFNESTSDRNDFHIRLLFSTPDGAFLADVETSRPTIQPLRVSLANRALKQPFHLRIELEGDVAYSSVLDPRPQQIVQVRPH
jgi:hypothetical protein